MCGGSRFGSGDDISDVLDSGTGGRTGVLTGEEGSEGLQDRLDVIHSRPFILQNIEANVSSSVYIRVETRSDELDFWRGAGIISRKG